MKNQPGGNMKLKSLVSPPKKDSTGSLESIKENVEMGLVSGAVKLWTASFKRKYKNMSVDNFRKWLHK